MTLSLWVECLRERSHSISVLRVQIDVTKVSIKKMDITGNNEVAGARLLLKDKEGNVIESWMSATEAMYLSRNSLREKRIHLQRLLRQAVMKLQQNYIYCK